MNDFCKIIQNISNHTINKIGDRYCGNASLRCSGSFLITKTNTPKDNITPADFVIPISKLCSIDTPTHKAIYEQFLNINYIIHGHAYLTMRIWEDPKISYLELIPMTKRKYKCGNSNVVKEIKKLSNHTVESGVSSFFMVNLKKHGFMIGTNNIKLMKLIFDRKLVEFNKVMK